MPHNSHNSHAGHTGTSGEDLSSTDEVKIYKDEGGDREEEKILSENLLEEKSSLIDLTESEEKSGKIISRQDHSPVFGKVEPHSSFNMGYLVSPYSYTNGTAGGLPVSMANKMGLPPFFCHNGDPLTTPPPAHCGIPPYQLDPKTMGLTRPTIYPFPASQYPYPMLSPDMSQVAASCFYDFRHTPSVYSAASGFRSPYPSSLPINTSLSSDFSFRFSPSLLPSVHSPSHHVINSHPAIVTPGPKQEIGQESNHRYGRISCSSPYCRTTLDHQKNSPGIQSDKQDSVNEKKKPHIKKPLNAFMLYMKEMRAKVVAECTLKESAAINQILGRRWHALGREEQAKYYELARRERQLHMQMYPDWSSRTNASRGKKRKRKQDPNDGGNNMKKCRARFGLDQQNQWCKPCRRKKKCIRYMEADGDDGPDLENHVSDDNLGSCGSVDDAKTPEDDTESLNQSLSSPGCGSVLSSLQSPSTSLASPLNLLASPSTPQSVMHPDHTSLFVDTNTNSNSMSQPKKTNNNNSINVGTAISSASASCITTTTSNTPSSSSSSIDGGGSSSGAGSGGGSGASGGSSGHYQSIGNLSPARHTEAIMFDQKNCGKSNLSGSIGSNSSGSLLNVMSSPRNDDVKPPKMHLPLCHPGQQQQIIHPQDLFYERAARNPVGVNPQDVNNPLSINQLTKPVYINHHSPIHHSHHHLLNICSPLSPASTSSASSMPSLHQNLHQHLSSPPQHQQQPPPPSPIQQQNHQQQPHQQQPTNHLHHHHLHQQQQQQQQQLHSQHRPQQHLHFSTPPHLHHHHHALALSQHLHLQSTLPHGYPVSPSASTITGTTIPAPQTATATHHRGGDDGGAISVT